MFGKPACLNNDLNHIELQEEKQWIEAARLNTEAFEPIYLRYYDEIYRFIYRRTGRETMSNEICSETFYQALSNIKKYQWRGIPFGNWLYTIASNELRKRYRNKKEVFIIEIDKFQEQLPVPEMLEHIGTEPLVRALDQLNELELRLIELKYFEHKTFREVGLLLEMKESAVKMRIYRLLLAMKKLINEQQHDQI